MDWTPAGWEKERKTKEDVTGNVNSKKICNYVGSSAGVK